MQRSGYGEKDGFWMYNASLYCYDCGKKIIEELTEKLQKEGKEIPDTDDEYSYDSDDFPKGICSAQSETDSPNFCDDCGQYLNETLTDTGINYVAENLEQDIKNESTNNSEEWAEMVDHIQDCYGLSIWQRMIFDTWLAEDF